MNWAEKCEEWEEKNREARLAWLRKRSGLESINKDGAVL